MEQKTSTSQAHISAFLGKKRAEQTRFLAELVRFPSDNPPGDCAPHAECAARLLEALGFEVERHKVPDALVQANGMISATSLVIRHRFGDGPVIALNAHGDVVAPGDGWTYDPYGAEIHDGVMYGRGVAVSKSDFATYAYALLALEELARMQGLQLHGTVELHLTYDEEVGGLIGPAYLLEKGISKPDFAISAGFAYKIITAHNGCLHLEVEIRGRSAHAAMPSTGVDALEVANAVLSRLYAERNALQSVQSGVEGIGSAQLTVGLISGGINTNVVPDKITFRLDRRIIPEENANDIEVALGRIIFAEIGRFAGASVLIRRILLAEPFVPMPGQEKLVKVLGHHASRIMGETVATGGVPIYTDARHYSAAGVPTVLYGAGPRTVLEANGHRANECLKLEDLFGATEVVALALLELLSAKPV